LVILFEVSGEYGADVGYHLPNRRISGLPGGASDTGRSLGRWPPPRHFATSHALSYRANVTLWRPAALFATFGRAAAKVNVLLWRARMTGGN
jgi:hypothetical protein